MYGNEAYKKLDREQLNNVLEGEGLDNLIGRFENGLETKIVSGGDSMSLGEKQLIAFIMAVLSKPDLLIMDEATANIDTITEKLL